MSRSGMICGLLSLCLTVLIGISANISRHEDSVRTAVELTYQALVEFTQQMGERPYSVTEPGFVRLLPRGRWLKNAYTGQTTEPRDWRETVGRLPVAGGV